MQIRPLFNKYQRLLLAFANTSFGRDYLSLQKWAKIKNNYKIIKVTPDGIHWWTGEFNKKGLPICQAVFFSKSPYLKKFRLALEGLEIASDVIGKIHNPEFIIPHFQGLTNVNWLPLIMRIETTFNPDADPETTSVDGGVKYYVSPTSAAIAWATARAHGGSVGDADGTNSILMDWATGNIDAQDKCSSLARQILLFDSKSLTSGATDLSGIFSVYGRSKSDANSDAPTYNVYSSNPASNTAIASTDFDINDFGSTAFCDTSLTYASIDTSGYNDFTLNANGINNISLTSISKFSTRWGGDVSNTKPKNGNNQSFNFSYYMADNGSNMPKLVVDYSLPAAGGSPMIFGGGLCLG